MHFCLCTKNLVVYDRYIVFFCVSICPSLFSISQFAFKETQEKQESFKEEVGGCVNLLIDICCHFKN